MKWWNIEDEIFYGCKWWNDEMLKYRGWNSMAARMKWWNIEDEFYGCNRWNDEMMKLILWLQKMKWWNDEISLMKFYDRGRFFSYSKPRTNLSPPPRKNEEFHRNKPRNRSFRMSSKTSDILSSIRKV